MIPGQKNQDFIGGALAGDTRQNAADFFEYLIKREIQLERGKGY
jgi:hypothetical protein